MKKFVVFVVLAMVLISSCAAQNAANDAQRIVGTWETDGGQTFVFNANGTGNGSGFAQSGLNRDFFWGVTITGVVRIVGVGEITFYLSPDGRRMIWDNLIFQKR